MENKGKLLVELSPGTFRRVEEDVDYRLRLVEEVAGNKFYEEVTFRPPSTEASGGSELIPDQDFFPIDRSELGHDFADDELPRGFDAESDSEPINCMPGCSSQAYKKLIWLDAPTKLLIAKLKEMRPKVGKTAKLKNKKHMWRAISEELCSKGYPFNEVQVETKFFSLERQYKRAQLNNTRTGRSRQICPYQAELDDLLQKRVAINPEYVLGSERAVDLRSTRDLSENSESASPSPENVESTPTSSRKRGRSTIEKVLEKYDIESDRQEQREMEWKQLFEENMKQRRVDAEKARELETRKLDILSSLVDILKK